MDYLFTGVVGSIVGSFFTLVSQRILIGASILQPRSHCFNCQTFLSWQELIPIFSYLKQKGRCSHCQVKFSSLSFKTELLMASLFIGLTYFNLWQVEYLPYFLLLFQAILLSLTDIIAFIVEPKIFFSLSFLVLISQLILFSHSSLHLVSGLLIFGLLTLFNLGKQRLGGGDILLISLWTTCLGAIAIAQILFVASLSALGYFFLTGKQHQPNPRIRFVPFLSFGLMLFLWLSIFRQ